VLAWAGAGLQRLKLPAWLPALVLVPFLWVSAAGAWGQFDSKIDHWTQRSARDAEAVMQYVNDHTTTNDVVVVPKQIYWLVKHAKRTMLTFCARYNGVVNDMPVPVLIPKEKYWFDCRLENAKYVVLEYGAQEVVLPDGRRGQLPLGIDAVYTVPALRGVKEIIQQMQQEKWPVAAQHGAYLVLANPRFAT